MTLAWMVFIPTAILFARYCRGQWPNRTPFGIQIWFHVSHVVEVLLICFNSRFYHCCTFNSTKFQVHRTCNLLGVAMTIAACKYFVFSLPYFAFSCLHFHSEGRVLERTSGVRFGPKRKTSLSNSLSSTCE